MNQINASGELGLLERYSDVINYWDFNWRKQGGASRMIEISKREAILPTGILWLCLQS